MLSFIVVTFSQLILTEITNKLYLLIIGCCSPMKETVMTFGWQGREVSEFVLNKTLKNAGRNANSLMSFFFILSDEPAAADNYKCLCFL